MGKNTRKEICPYCRQAKGKKQRHDYMGQAAGMMCDDCWATSGLNPQRQTRGKNEFNDSGIS